MIGLFFFGRVAEQVYGSQKFLGMYLTAILLGAVAFILTALASRQPAYASVLGASGGVVAVVLLFCLKFPHQKVYLLFLPFVGIPAWILGIVYVVSDLLGVFGVRHGNVAFTVHLAGAAYAYLFYRTQWELGQYIPGFWTGSVTKMFKSRPKLKVHSVEEDEDDLAERADVILKKLYEQGESSLTHRERKILEQYSRRMKQKNR